MKPILFNTEMVKAIMDGRKTVTRRVVKPRYRDGEAGFQIITNKHTGEHIRVEIYDEWEEVTRWLNPPYKPGDILYVRETWKCYTAGTAGPGLIDGYLYKADEPQDTTGMMVEDRWRPSIHMPKEAARIFLLVTDVRAERLQDIDEDGVCDEGAEKLISGCEHINYSAMPPEPCYNTNQCEDCIINYGYPELFGKRVWNDTIKPADRDRYGWEANPWVWVIEFERCEKP